VIRFDAEVAGLFGIITETTGTRGAGPTVGSDRDTPRWCSQRECLLLDRKISVQVDLHRRDLLMAEPESDCRDVDASSRRNIAQVCLYVEFP